MIRLSKIQLFLILFIAQTGGVFISFQQPLILAAKNNAWWIIIVTGVFQYIVLLIFEKNYNDLYIPPWVTWIFKAYWLFILTVSISYVVFVLSSWSFLQTPKFVFLLIIFATTFYISSSRNSTMINLGVAAIPVIVIFLLSLTMIFPQLEWTKVLPIGQLAPDQYVRSFIVAQAPVYGVELYLFLRPYVTQEKSLAGSPLFVYQIMWTSFYTLSTLVVLLYFSLKEVENIPQPVLYMLKSLHVSFVERLDVFFIITWVVWGIISVGIYLFMVLRVWPAKTASGVKKQTVAIHFLLFAATMTLLSNEWSKEIPQIIPYVHLVVGIALPMLLIIVTKGRARWGKSSSSS